MDSRTEQERRASEKEGWDKAKEEKAAWQAEWYRTKMLENTFEWEAIRGGPKEGKSSSTPNINADGNDSLLGEGLYKIRKRTSIDVRKNQDGSLNVEILNLGILPGSKRAAFSDTMDFLAAGCGLTNIKLDWDKPGDVNLKDLDTIIALAKEKGLTIEFGPNVEKRLKELGLYEKYMEQLNDVYQEQQKNFKKHGHTQQSEKFDTMRASNNLTRTEKLEGNTTDEKKQKLREKTLKAEDGSDLQGEERLTAVKKEMAQDDQRYKRLDGARNQVEGSVKRQEQELADPNCKSAQAAKVAEDAAEHREGRAELLQQTKLEKADLKTRMEVWKEELAAMKATLPADESARSDEQKKLAAEIAKQETMITKQEAKQSEYEIPPPPPPPLPANATEEQKTAHKQQVEAARTNDKTIDGLEKRVNALPEKAQNKQQDLAAAEAAPPVAAADKPLQLDNNSQAEVHALKDNIDNDPAYNRLDDSQKGALKDVLDKYAKGKDADGSDYNSDKAQRELAALSESPGLIPEEKAQMQAAAGRVNQFMEKNAQNAPSQPGIRR